MRTRWMTGLFLWLLLGPSAVESQIATSGAFVGDDRNSCKVWDPHPQPGETASWSGACADGLAQGEGTVVWSRYGSPFEKDDGRWEKGRQSGHGIQDWKTGRYEGELSEGEPSGHGVMMLQTSRYEGEFRGGKPNGQGTATNIHGRFEGVWKDGCLSQGKQTIAFAVSPMSCR